jgi:aldehyde:ferredoxin oxidoreductase
LVSAFMFGWNGYLLNVDLTNKQSFTEAYNSDFASDYLGGRGFAVKLLWGRLPRGTHPLSPNNLLIFATGPLTGFALPNAGKLVVASKSPLTGGYGDGNIGTWAAVHMRKAGYEAIVVKGKAEKPTVLLVRDKSVEFLDASKLWGLNTFETEAALKEKYGRKAGIVSIGQGGENLVNFACVMSQEGRGGGRPGMGAVMGSKNLKALVIEGSGEIPAAYAEKLKEAGLEGYREIQQKPNYSFWKRQGTMSTVEWANANSVLPTYNYREGTFADADKVGGVAMEKIRSSNRGCPLCNMTCGNVVKDSEQKYAELDYENIGMLGANVGIKNLEEASTLNRLADEFSLDTISLGNTLGFAVEASQKGLISEKLEWGNFIQLKALTEDIACRRGLGNVLAEGVQNAAKQIGGDSSDWAMHVKGLEISAYNCFTLPAMALAYGTSPIGAHHKDAWVIGWETQHDRFGYNQEKAAYVIDAQHTRGIFECFGVCRFPVVNLGFEKDWYPKYLNLATGQNFNWDKLNLISERVFNLMRAFWIREYNGEWNSTLDYPPQRWFNESLTEGPLKGSKLDKEKYGALLQTYYSKRGWDSNGIPAKEKLAQLGLMGFQSN